MYNFDKELIKKARFYFYDVTIHREKPEVVKYYKDYCEMKNTDFNEVYNKALRDHVSILFTSWQYETPSTFYTNEELQNIIDEEEEMLKNDGLYEFLYDNN